MLYLSWLALTLTTVYLDKCLFFFFFLAIFTLTRGLGLLSSTSKVKQLFSIFTLFLARAKLLVNAKQLSLNFVENG